MELNPDHPVTKSAHNHWHKICAIILIQQGLKEVVLSPVDIKALGENKDIVLFEGKDGLHVRLMDHNDAVAFAAINGVEI